MISTLLGQVIDLSTDAVVVTVSGVGYEVAVTPRHLQYLRIGQEISLHTRMVVREDSISLFGFETRADREKFDLLCSVSGIGPKLAMTVLAGMDADTIANAVISGDEQAFRNIPGVGPKTAKLILLSLAGKVQVTIPSNVSKVLAALKQLGTDETIAREVLVGIDGGLSESQMLKEALKQIGSRK